MTHDTDTKSRLQFLEGPNTLATALQTGHDYVEELITAAKKMLQEINKRGWLP